MAKKPRHKGISVGTIAMLIICAVTLLMGGFIFTQISGDIEDISLDPSLLTEPLTMLVRNAAEPGSAGTGGLPGSDDPLALASPTDTPAPTPTPEPTPPPVRTMTLTAVGEISFGNELRLSGRDNATSSYDFSSILAPMNAAISGADLSIATLRASLSDTPSDFDAYCAPPQLATALQSAGFNLINLSTDRLLDHGTAGVSKTREVLRGASISAAGGYTTEDERQALNVREIQGIKVGLLSFTANISSAGKKAASEAEITTATRGYDIGALTGDITALRQKGAEVIIVLAHWGSRGDSQPSTEVRAAADALVSAGADIILGTNPNIVHEFERRTLTDASGKTREVFIAYSLGNFLTDESRETPHITSLVLHLTLQWDAQTQRLSFADSWYMPTWIMRWKDANGVLRYRIVPSGTSTSPDNMTEAIYTNMGKTYQNMVTKLGETYAKPKPEP